MSQDHDDSGLSLVELIMTIVILSLLVGGIATIFSNIWSTQSSVASVTNATNQGQVISSEIERAVRNAISFSVSTDSTGSTLLVNTDLGGNSTCQGFYFAGGSARMTVNAGPLAADPTTWPLWQAGVTQDAGSPFFTQVGTSLRYSFDLTTESAPVRFAGQAGMRTASSGVTSPCW